MAVRTHHSLRGLEVGLSITGDVEFSAPGWKVKLSPSNFEVTAPKLYKGESIQVLRGEDAETGLSFDTDFSRHFFLFGKPPLSKKISVNLEVRLTYTHYDFNFFTTANIWFN